ncbi:MAG: ATP phosphoribosyltransferase regulatory subunit [Lachnospiraceae bacterium]|nr:ATP phosphoribosyltransferase regulatory subunit [Lachnospiraceae bacterium]
MKNLLSTPEGVRDLSGEELRRKRYIEERLLGTVRSFGYEEIETPAFEYFDVFSGEVGTTPSRELYKFFDKDGETLALRPDFTPSVVRHAAGVYKGGGEKLRFSYLGKTFNNVTSLQGKKREVTQLGVEFFGDATAYGDAEILGLVVRALWHTGLKDFQIAIGNADFFRGLCEEAGLDDVMEERLRGFVKAKNQVQAETLLAGLDIDKGISEILLKCADLFGDFDSLKEAEALMPKGESAGLAKSRAALERLQRVYELLAPYGAQGHISFDLGLLSKYHYYSGLIFKGYTYGHGDAIVTGGRYDHLGGLFGKEMPAIGFAVVIDDLMRAMEWQKGDMGEPRQVSEETFTAQEYERKVKEALDRRERGEEVVLDYVGD